MGVQILHAGIARTPDRMLLQYVADSVWCVAGSGSADGAAYWNLSRKERCVDAEVARNKVNSPDW
jgi:hypothetical protein